MTDLTRRFAFVQTQEDGSQNLVLADEVESRGSRCLSPPHTIRAVTHQHSGSPDDDFYRDLYRAHHIAVQPLPGGVQQLARHVRRWRHDLVQQLDLQHDGWELVVYGQPAGFLRPQQIGTRIVAAYDAFLALQASRGWIPNILAQDTFQVVIDPHFAFATAQVVGPVWLQDRNVPSGLQAQHCQPFGPSAGWASDTFVLEFGVEGKIRRYNADMYLKPPRRQADPFEVRTTAAGASVVFYRGSELEVRIHSPSRHPPPNFRSVVPIKAEFVAGYAPLA